MRFLLSGYYGFSNAGDEAVLSAILQGLSRHFPGCEPCVLSDSPEATVREHGVEAVQRWSMGDVWRELGRADVLMQGGGSLIQDATSVKSPLYYLGVLRMARLRRVPSIIFAQGFGPLRSPLLRHLVRREYAAVAAITSRDVETVHALEQLGVRRVQPVLTADPAVLLQADPAAAEDALREAGVALDRRLLLISLRDWPGVDRIIPMLAAITERVSQRHGLQTIAVPFQEPDDVAVAETLCRADRRTLLVHSPGGPAQLIGLVARSRLVISMRLHGIIFAAAQGIPAVGISYDPKLEAFGGRTAQPVIRLDGCTPERLNATVDSLLGDAEAMRESREAAARELQAAAERNFEVLETVLAGR